ncbi:MAG: twin-arginine translocase subunit TatC [Frankiaceae bacterium]
MATAPSGHSPQPAGDGARMTLGEHLRELRRRVIKSALGVAAGTILSFAFYDPIFKVLTHPFCSLPESRRGIDDGHIDQTCHLYFFHPLDAFAIRLRVGIIVGILISSPVWLYQLWAFITPGLKRNERRWALTFVGASSALFAIGGLLCYLTLPKALSFLLGAVGDNAQSVLGIDQYLGFTTSMLIIFGASFELPLVLVILNLTGLLSAKRMASWRRPAIFLLFVFAAVITPSQDPITMTVMGGGLAILYEVAVVIGRVHDRRAAQRRAEIWAALDSDDPAAALLARKGRTASVDGAVDDPGRAVHPA